MSRIADSRLRHDVRQALIQYGDRIVGTLGDYLHDPKESLRVRANIPKVLSEMNSQEAVNALVRSLPRLDPFLGHRAIKALNKMRVRFPRLSFADDAIDLAILDELRDYYEFGIMLRSDEMQRLRIGRFCACCARLCRSAWIRSLNECSDCWVFDILRLISIPLTTVCGASEATCEPVPSSFWTTCCCRT